MAPTRVPAEDRSEAFWSRLAAGWVVGIVAVVIIGWTTGHSQLASFVPGNARMVLNTAASVLVCSVGLLALASGWRKAARACGAVVTAFALVILVQFVWGRPLGVDDLLTKHLGMLKLPPTGRIAPNTAVGLALIGVALMLRSTGRTRHWWMPLTGGTLIAFALFPFLAYVGGLEFSATPTAYRGMSVPTAICLLALAFGIGWRRGNGVDDDWVSLPLFATAVGVLLAIGIISVEANSDLTDANSMVNHTYRVRSDIDHLVSQVARMESTVRAFALTGQEPYRQRYFDHRAEILDKIRDLESLVRDNPGQHARVVQLGPLAQTKLAQNASILQARQEGGAAGAGRALAALPTLGTSALVNLADSIEQEEDRLLTGRDEERTRIERIARIEQIIGCLFALGLISAAVSFAGRSAKVRTEAEKKLLATHATLAASEERFRQAFDFAGIGMALVGLDGRWLRVNTSLCDIVGYTEAEFLTKNFQDITYPADLPADLALAQELLAGKRRFFQRVKRYVHQTGQVLWVEVTVSLVRDLENKPLYFVTQVKDVTDRKRLEENLLQARDGALEASRLKSAFLANMSHEIRTPMNAVIGMSELLADSPLDPSQKELIRGIQSGAESLLIVIDDILDFSKIEAGKLRLDRAPFDLRRLLRETIAFLEARAREKHLGLIRRLGPDGPLAVMGDSGRVRQVLTNIIGNAIKFSDHGEVEVTLEEREGGERRRKVRVSVRDTGIGIPPEAQATLFQPFIQGETTTTRRFGGTGLGLAISRQIVELMGGQIGVKSESGKGSVFWFDVEFDRAEPLAVAPVAAVAAPAGPRPARPLHVLVVDDNFANQTVARLMLASLGHSAAIAGDGQAALDRLATEAFDCVFMDCQMPVLDGYETTRRIRAGLVPGANAQVPIVAFTAYAMREDQAKCLAAGMDDYISKPILIPELVAVLRRRGLAGEGEPVEASLRRRPTEAVFDPAALASARALPGMRGPSLLPELIERYLQEEPKLLAQLSALAAARSAAPLALSAHSFAGEAASFGAILVRKAALNLESAAQAEDWPVVADRLTALGDAAQDLRSALAELA